MQAPTFSGSWKQLEVNTAFGKLAEGFFFLLPEDYLYYLYHLYYWSGCTMFFLSFTFQQGHGETGTHPEKNKMIEWLENWFLRLACEKGPKT